MSRASLVRVHDAALEVGGVEPGDELGPGDDEKFVAALEIGAAEVGGPLRDQPRPDQVEAGQDPRLLAFREAAVEADPRIAGALERGARSA